MLIYEITSYFVEVLHTFQVYVAIYYLNLVGKIFDRGTVLWGYCVTFSHV